MFNEHTYDDVEKMCIANGNGWLGEYYFMADDAFIQFKHSTASLKMADGWKIHLSVDPADIRRATGIVLEVFSKFEAPIFKVTRSPTTEKFAHPGEPQAGKMFTLYSHGEKNWPQILQAIETRFRQARIQPSQPVTEDVPVTGSLYAYRRNDRNPYASPNSENRYISAVEARKINPAFPHNPYNLPDPLEGLDLGVNQYSTAQNKVCASTLDEFSIYHDLRNIFGDNVQRVLSNIDPQGQLTYHVAVPSDFSRVNFVRGLNIQNASLIGRKQIDADTHRVVIPFVSLPSGIRQDAGFFRAISLADIPVSNAYRLAGHAGTTAAYVLDVPADYSRRSLTQIGIDINHVTRRGLNLNIHQLLVPLRAVADITVASRPRLGTTPMFNKFAPNVTMLRNSSLE